MFVKKAQKALYLVARANYCFSTPKWGMIDSEELFDDEAALDEKARRLAEALSNSRNAICFTGAGLSTSAGVPDYRSSYKTVLPTGPGEWESAENKKKYTKTANKIPTKKAKPTKAHRAIAELVNKGIIKHIVTQNVDGLHRRSGVPESQMHELHGTMNKERCTKCNQEFLRDTNVRNYALLKHELDHTTGRFCPCPERGELVDTLVLFGERLPEGLFDRTVAKVKDSDLCLAIGSSLKVNPASQLPRHFTTTPEKKLALVGIQKTHLDQKCWLKINGLCDVVMEKVMHSLGLSIPPFKLTRRMRVMHTDNMLTINGRDKEGNIINYISKMDVVIRTSEREEFYTLHDYENFVLHYEGDLRDVILHLYFYDTLDEKDLVINIDPSDFQEHVGMSSKQKILDLEYVYNFENETWMRALDKKSLDLNDKSYLGEGENL